ncbi:hypothetical protein L2E82_45274 [Cichorium intybus]|uniref:Uncharacterized protein n=1 Tax=Cichorium intybus TaxID=13427 RepID=A0ACB8ZS40_CICIN|nr:hypothetical protein L2E82_45274 [Cichorium intybus]
MIMGHGWKVGIGPQPSNKCKTLTAVREQELRRCCKELTDGFGERNYRCHYSLSNGPINEKLQQLFGLDFNWKSLLSPRVMIRTEGGLHNRFYEIDFAEIRLDNLRIAVTGKKPLTGSSCADEGSMSDEQWLG